MFRTEASRERWTLVCALFAVVISLGALGISYLQVRSSDRAVAIADQARQDAVTEADRQRRDAKDTLDQQRKDAAVALEEQTKRADRANALADRSAKAAEATAKVSAEQLEIGERPWVKVVEVKPRSGTPLRFTDITAYRKVEGQKYTVDFFYEVHLKIIGPSPALNIDVWPELYLPEWSSQTVGHVGYSNAVVAEENRVCNEFAKRKKEIKGGGTAAFPNETPVLYQGAQANIFEVNKSHFSDMPGEYILPVLIGCVDYQFQSSEKHHQTRFVYEAFHAKGSTLRFFLVGKDILADDLQLIRNDTDDYAY
jgi:hypothetical protein